MPLSSSSQVRQLSDGNSAGTVLGTTQSDLIGFYGHAATSQVSGAAQAALARGVGGGLVATTAYTTTPASTPINDANEVTLNLFTQLSNSGSGFAWSLSSTDVLLTNKPTQQAGIGIGMTRFVNATQVAVGMTNLTAATVSSTAGEKWTTVAIRGIPSTTQTITPAVVSAASTNEQIFTVNGIRTGEVVLVNGPAATTHIIMAGARVAGPNQVGITFMNASPTTATTPPAGTYTFWSTGGIDMANNTLVVETINPTLPGPAGSTTSSFSYTVTGLLTTDIVAGITKPTQQAGIAFTGAFVAAANVLGVNYTNFGPTVTPTASEIYGLTLNRTSGNLAPAVVYTQTLTPAAVGPNTTTSQNFTVTGLINSSVVFVNKPTAQVGLGILGSRVSGANILEITYANNTAATITPTAGEVYVIANFQQTFPDAGTTWIVQVTPQQQADTVLTNAIRNAMVSMGQIAGA